METAKGDSRGMVGSGGMHAPAEILLIRPRDISMTAFKKIGAMQHPLNLVYLATWLSQHGHKPEILDLDVEPFQQLKNKLKNSPPYLVGITAITPNIPDVKLICECCQSFGVKTVVGGVHATIMPVETLQDTGCDYVILGAGEIPLQKLLTEIKSGRTPGMIEGLGYLKNGLPVINPQQEPTDIDMLPVPDRRFLKLNLYAGEISPGITGKAAPMFTSLGCPFKCAFCASKIVNQQRIRYRSLDKVFAEIDDIASLGFKHIYIDDESFGLNETRVKEFCHYLIDKHPEISWNCQMRIGSIREDLLQLMKRSNCKKISFGVESGSVQILKSIHKNIHLDRVIHDFNLVKKFKILTQAFFMVGFPEETREDIAATEELIQKIRPDFLFLSVCTPFPGTEIYYYMLQNKLLESTEWEKFIFFGNNVPWKTKYFSGREIVQLRNTISNNYYLSFRYIVDRLLALRSFRDLHYLVRGAIGVWSVFGDNRNA